METKENEIFREWNDIFGCFFEGISCGHYYGVQFIIHTNEQGKHNKPHLHARCQSQEIVIEIPTGKILSGKMEHKKAALARQWVIEHSSLLTKNWNQFSNGVKMDQFGLIVSSEY